MRARTPRAAPIARQGIAAAPDGAEIHRRPCSPGRRRRPVPARIASSRGDRAGVRRGARGRGGARSERACGSARCARAGVLTTEARLGRRCRARDRAVARGLHPDGAEVHGGRGWLLRTERLPFDAALDRRGGVMARPGGAGAGGGARRAGASRRGRQRARRWRVPCCCARRRAGGTRRRVALDLAARRRRGRGRAGADRAASARGRPRRWRDADPRAWSGLRPMAPDGLPVVGRVRGRRVSSSTAATPHSACRPRRPPPHGWRTEMWPARSGLLHELDPGRFADFGPVFPQTRLEEL